MSWWESLRIDPLPPLLSSGHPAVCYWASWDLLGNRVEAPSAALWALDIPRGIVRRQEPAGSWKYPGRHPRSQTDYDLLETYRQLGFLVEMFGFSREHPALAAAGEYVLAHQSADGDIKGIYGHQFSPNYTAALVELLVKAGYEDDPRVERAFAWLEDVRQDDGGWALPLRTRGRKLDALDDDVIIEGDRSRPFSHLITGVVLRAYAAHPEYRSSPTARRAAELLATRFFEPDAYPDKGRREDWTEFSYPFWMTDVVSALNSISMIQPGLATDKTAMARDWLVEHQEPSGLFGGHLLRDRFHDLRLWFSLAVCRVFHRMQGPSPSTRSPSQGHPAVRTPRPQ